jgi:hypothetical protein
MSGDYRLPGINKANKLTVQACPLTIKFNHLRLEFELPETKKGRASLASPSSQSLLKSALALRLGKDISAFKIYEHERLVAINPGIMPRRNNAHVARSPFEFRAIVHPHLHAPGNDIPLVRDLATITSGDGFDAFGPTPPRLESRAHQRQTADFNDFRTPFVKRACFVWMIEVLPDID